MPVSIDTNGHPGRTCAVIADVLNTSSPKVILLLKNVIDVKLVQLKNASSCILVTDAGIVE